MEIIKVYKFEELTDKAKAKALDKYRYINVECEWYEYIYSDIKTHLGINIAGFNLNRGGDVEFDFKYKNINNKFLRGLISTFPDCEWLIQLTEYYLSESDRMDKLDFSVDEIENSLSYEGEEIRKDLESEILSMLRSQFEYLTSDESILEQFECMDYEFLDNGEIY